MRPEFGRTQYLGSGEHSERKNRAAKICVLLGCGGLDLEGDRAAVGILEFERLRNFNRERLFVLVSGPMDT